MFGAGAATFPLSLSVIAIDVAGYTKKTCRQWNLVSGALRWEYFRSRNIFGKGSSMVSNRAVKVHPNVVPGNPAPALAARQHMDWE